MVFLWNAFYFVVALGILVTIHEFGHFWVARKLGVKVLTFSVGFGKPLWQRKAKDGVNYVIAAIPLGGYVKMLDERESEVSPEEQQYAFNRKSVWARMAIVLAGPVANFILAIVLYWWMFVLGINGLSTELGIIDENSIAGKAGLVEGQVITKVDGETVYLLQDVVKAVARRLGETSNIEIEVKHKDSNHTKIINLPLNDWHVDSSKPEIIESLGIRHKIYDSVIEPIIAEVSQGSPADLAGILVNDRIMKFNQQSITTWPQLVELIQPQANKEAELIIQRNGELTRISVVIGSRTENNKTIGLLGVGPFNPDRSMYFTNRKGEFAESFLLAVNETGKMIDLSVSLFAKLITGDISTKSLSGPLSIAEGAGRSAGAGLVYFISFVAMISVNLGFINLLPVPLLDGGHMLYFVIEAVKGKPLSTKVQEIGLQIGMLMVFALMAIAIFNDFSRL
jgi:regulator of sigma E protease